MDIGELKRKAIDGAARLARSETAQDLLANRDLQRALGKAFEASAKLRREWKSVRKGLAHQLQLATEDDLREMKQRLRDLEHSSRATEESKPAAKPRARGASASRRKD